MRKMPQVPSVPKSLSAAVRHSKWAEGEKGLCDATSDDQHLAEFLFSDVGKL
jgi:hypothetical protein